MRVHLTGESQGAVRVAPCKNVPAACKDFYLAEREREAAKSREKQAARTKIYNDAAQLSRTETDRKRKAEEEEPVKDVNPRTLNMTNFKHVDHVPINSMMVSLISLKEI